MTESETILATSNIDEVIENEQRYMLERDFILDVVPTFIEGYDEDGKAKTDGPQVAVQTLMAIREGKEHAPESNGLPIGNLMLDFIVDGEPVVGKRVAFKAPLFTLQHIADAIYEAVNQYDRNANPRAYSARDDLTRRMGLPDRIASLMTDKEVLDMTFKRLGF